MWILSVFYSTFQPCPSFLICRNTRREGTKRRHGPRWKNGTHRTERLTLPVLGFKHFINIFLKYCAVLGVACSLEDCSSQPSHCGVLSKQHQKRRKFITQKSSQHWWSLGCFTDGLNAGETFPSWDKYYIKNKITFFVQLFQCCLWTNSSFIAVFLTHKDLRSNGCKTFYI